MQGRGCCRSSENFGEPRGRSALPGGNGGPHEWLAAEMKPQTDSERLLCSGLVQRKHGGRAWGRPGRSDGNKACADCCCRTNQDKPGLFRGLVDQRDNDELPRLRPESRHNGIH